MYTEDDENVEVKNSKSKNNYSDFYTAFSNQEEPDNKKPKKEKNKKAEEKEEEYEDYNVDYEEEVADDNSVKGGFYEYGSKKREKKDSSNGNTKKIIIGVVIAIIIIILIVLLFIFLGKPKGDIELNNSNVELKAGEKSYISFKIVGTDSDVTTNFTSSNENVAIVSENGEITAVGNGEATITIKYTIDGKTREKECKVKVEGPEVKHELSLDLKSSSTGWTNKDVVITVNAKSDTSVTSIKYAINCNGNCDYKDVNNNQVTITENGTTKVTVIAKDKMNQEITKEITVKIDKEAPTITFNNKDITSSKDVTVCATCNDSLSGCKEAKVCKKYTSSKSNEIITIYDNAGNSKSSSSFNVKINKVLPPCTLKVSSDGTVTASLGETATYYGFSSSYSGTNELTKKITINGDKGAMIVNYYVKNKNGVKNSCKITVIKESGKYRQG